MNVLLITTDQQRADSIGAYGNPVCRTPNLDALAAAGTCYTAARTQNPFCQPARATILTGQYPSTHGVTWNGHDLPEDATEQSVATRFAEAGYATALVGKAHFGSVYPFYPTNHIESVAGSALVDPDWTGPYHGFDFVQLVLFGHALRIAPLMGEFNWIFGPPPFGLHYGRWLARDGMDAAAERLRLMQPEAAGAMWDHTQTWRSVLPEEDHPITYTADRAIDWLGERARDGRDFFGWVSFTDPHHPMDPPARWFDMYDAADVAEVLPEKRPEEFDTKPPVHRLWSQGNRGRTFEWANPGGAQLTDKELARMTAAYYGLVTMLDHHIGRVLDALDRSGLAENTPVIMTGDHGEYLGHHQMVFKGPLHYEGLLRVPLIVRGPGVDPGAVVDDPVGTVDLQPTMLAAAGLPIPDYCEGDVLPGLGLGGRRREYNLTEDDFDAVVRLPTRTITTRRYKLTRWMDSPEAGELYDLDEDPDEFVNRWADPALGELRSDLEATLLDEQRPLGRRLPKVALVG